MRFMMMVKANPESEAGAVPSEKEMTEMGNYNAALAEAGVMLTGEGLLSSAQGCRVHYLSDSKKVRVTDGPFAEAKELVAGYWIVQTPTLADAVGWAKRVPFESGEVELRRLYEAEDFPEQTDAAAEEEQHMRDAATTAAKAPVTGKDTHRYIVMVHGSAMTELPAPHSPEGMARMNAIMEDLIARGALLGGEGLRPSREGARVRYDGRERRVIDGPFSESKELIAGYIVMRGTKAEATEFAKRWAEVHVDAEPGKQLPECVIEIRQIAESEDFPVDPAEKADGWRAQEKKLREKLQV